MPTNEEDVEKCLNIDWTKQKKKRTRTPSTESSISDSGIPIYDYGIMLANAIDQGVKQHHDNKLTAEAFAKEYGTETSLIDNRLSLPKLVITKQGRKTTFMNFNNVCNHIKRVPDHLSEFLTTELVVKGSINEQKQLVLCKRVDIKYLESLIRKYCIEYVKCKECSSPDTVLEKNSVLRLYFVKCQNCRTEKTATLINPGYHAKTKADRQKEKA